MGKQRNRRLVPASSGSEGRNQDSLHSWIPPPQRPPGRWVFSVFTLMPLAPWGLTLGVLPPLAPLSPARVKGPSPRRHLQRHEGATCRAAGALPEKGRSEGERGPAAGQAPAVPTGNKEVWINGVRKDSRCSPDHSFSYPFSLLPLADGKFFSMSNLHPSDCSGSLFHCRATGQPQSL